MSALAPSAPVAPALAKEQLAIAVVDFFKSNENSPVPSEAQKNMSAVIKDKLGYDVTYAEGAVGAEALIRKATTDPVNFKAEIIRRINNKPGTDAQNEASNALYAALNQPPSSQPAVATPAMPAPQPTPMQTAAVPALNHEQASEALLGYLQKNRNNIPSLPDANWEALKADPIFKAVEASIKTGLGNFKDYANFTDQQSTATTLKGFEDYKSMVPAPAQLLAGVAASDIQALHQKFKHYMEPAA